jgi:hypothetical protein
MNNIRTSRNRPQDNQRALVSAWERQIEGYHRPPLWKTMEDVIAWAKPIWRAERGRYGLARRVTPEMVAASWGQRRALAHSLSLSK